MSAVQHEAVPYYDDEAGIARAAGTLAGLHALLRERHDAGYVRRERLREWVVRGRISLDTCGNAMVLSDGLTAAEVAMLSRRVVSRERFHQLVGESRFVSFALRPIPRATDACDLCGGGWTILDWHEAHQHDRAAWRHDGCEREWLRQDEREIVSSALRAAGFEKFFLVEVNNAYEDGRHPARPWFRVMTVCGSLVIGKRKRVREVDWSALRVGPLDFSNEYVTNGPTYVHAWTVAKLTEYLGRIRAAMVSARSAPDDTSQGGQTP